MSNYLKCFEHAYRRTVQLLATMWMEVVVEYFVLVTISTKNVLQ